MRFGGVTEVASELEVSRQRLLRLREREDFPQPVQELAQGPIWDLDAIRRWNGSGIRASGAGRPRTEVTARTLGGRFLLEEKIGTGGFAEVWRATDRRAAGTGVDVVAVKVLHGFHLAKPDYVARFRKERELLLKLDHPNVMKLHASEDLDDGRVWMAMPLAQRSLADEREHFVGNPVRINDLFTQVCAGVEYLHQNKILHRDLTPGNVLLTSQQTWAISDFGLAVEVERTTRITPKTQVGMGTDDYAAPEQLWRAFDATEASDIYSLGKILQFLVTGQRPVGAMRVSSPFRSVVDTATSTEPATRYPSVAAFRAAMQRALNAEATASWEAPADTAQRLLERVRLDQPAAADLDELMNWAGRLDDHNTDQMRLLITVLSRLSRRSIQILWRDRREAFLNAYLRYARRIQETTSLGFEFCDVVADFCASAVAVTEDDTVLRATISALTELGHHHNRWHVRGVVIDLLQAIHTHHDAGAAVEGLAATGDDALSWALSNFTLRSLHPHLREHVSDRLGDPDEPGDTDEPADGGDISF